MKLTYSSKPGYFKLNGVDIKEEYLMNAIVNLSELERVTGEETLEHNGDLITDVLFDAKHYEEIEENTRDYKLIDIRNVSEDERIRLLDKWSNILKNSIITRPGVYSEFKAWFGNNDLITDQRIYAIILELHQYLISHPTQYKYITAKGYAALKSIATTMYTEECNTASEWIKQTLTDKSDTEEDYVVKNIMNLVNCSMESVEEFFLPDYKVEKTKTEKLENIK